MRNLFDFSSWSATLSTLFGLLLATLVMVGIRLVFMQTLQRRRERENRQINERLKTLIAAYKTLGGSFTGQLQVSPTHLRDLHRPPVGMSRSSHTAPGAESGDSATLVDSSSNKDNDDAPIDALLSGSTERQRRTRDAVEAALSDVILLGTEEQVRLATQAAQDMVAGRSVEVAPLVVSLRQFIRTALDLEPIPSTLAIPQQGPLRPGGAGTAGRRASPGDRSAGAAGGRTGGGGGGAGGGGMGAMAMGAGAHRAVDDLSGSGPA
ncbi:hypothetical protein [Acidovorax sp. FHTAMBA]|jgi:hypothetical protein|uniref:hypothetical protein n=1 Tax=Acidovorax sp. FHTAMBA TaxID=3140252 RepID=UPI0015F35950